MAPDGGPHAELDAAAFEGRSGGAGGAGQPLLVADDDLAVGADIDEQGQLGVFVDPRGQDPGDDIAARRNWTRNSPYR